MNEEMTTDEKPGGLLSRIPSMLSKNRMLLSVIAFLYLFPLTTRAEFSPERDLLNVLTQIMIFGLLAMSFDLQLGRAGLLNFGHVALFGIGAYFAAFMLPFGEANLLPFPVTIVLAMLLGAFLGFVMGLTTSRMKGTAFAFIALAIAMFLFNFFAENSDISGGETGLIVATPDIMTAWPTYIFFVAIAFLTIIGFFGMMVIYVQRRTESIGPVYFTPVMLALVGVLLFFGANILGSILIIVAWVAMLMLSRMKKAEVIEEPLEFKEELITKQDNPMTKRILPIAIVVLGTLGIIVGFGANILEMAVLWITQPGSVFLYRIPAQYYLVLSCLVAVFIFIRRLVGSPFGRMVTAVAQNEERAEALGYNSYLAKIVVVVISGAIAALAGALYAPFIRTIDPPTALGVEISIDAMLYTIIGGLGTLFGPLLGTGVVVYSELNLVDLLGELWLVGLGIAYIIIVLFLPLGIVGSASVKSRSLKERLQRVKIGGLEFGLKQGDYWIFTALGTVALFLTLLFITTL